MSEEIGKVEEMIKAKESFRRAPKRREDNFITEIRWTPLSRQKIRLFMLHFGVLNSV